MASTLRLSSSPEDIARAADILRRGGLVAFPTETVYGLGADAGSEAAVQRIYTAKGRPSSNPLIVHVAGEDQAQQYAVWNAAASRLAAAFWPGPLTLVLPLRGGIAAGVLAGGTTVGVRAPAHPVAAALLAACGLPLAAPSANASNRISPTTAAAVLDTLDGRIDAVVDGGSCAVGIESTVLDLTSATPRVLRPGGISREQIAAALGSPVDGPNNAAATSAPLRSPGLQERHYAPHLPTRMVAAGEPIPHDATAWLIACGPLPEGGPRGESLPADPAAYARELYAALRRAESTAGVTHILIQLPPHSPSWEAVHDRLRRAAWG